jgi:hypothetical protein
VLGDSSDMKKGHTQRTDFRNAHEMENRKKETKIKDTFLDTCDKSLETWQQLIWITSKGL